MQREVGEENKGFQMLRRMGWQSGAIGQSQDGLVEPIDPLEEQINITKKVLSPEVFLKPHMNPMCLERSTETKKTKMKLVGPG
jgi:hypothetical protein